jgi:hypothetical protein
MLSTIAAVAGSSSFLAVALLLIYKIAMRITDDSLQFEPGKSVLTFPSDLLNEFSTSDTSSKQAAMPPNTLNFSFSSRIAKRVEAKGTSLSHWRFVLVKSIAGYS